MRTAHLNLKLKNSSYERIYDKAKAQGMSLKNDNVKVVRNDGEAKIKIKNKLEQSSLLVYSDCSFYIGFKILIYHGDRTFFWTRLTNTSK